MLECRIFTVFDLCFFQYFSSVFSITKRVPPDWHDFQVPLFDNVVFLFILLSRLFSYLLNYVFVLCVCVFLSFLGNEMLHKLSFGLQVYSLLNFGGGHYGYGICKKPFTL